MMVHRRPKGVPAEGAPRGARGETLIEVLVTVVLMGVGFTAILGGILASVRVADQNHQRTRAGNGVQNWAEIVLQPAKPIVTPTSIGETPQTDYSTYGACARPAFYGAIGGLPSGYTAEITRIRYLSHFDGNGAPVWEASQSVCENFFLTQTSAPDGQGNPVNYFVDRGLQEITLKIDSGPRATGQVIDTLVIVKRDQRCPGTFDNADLGPC